MRQIILDTETTGLEPSQGHRIIEVGCVELLDRKLTGKRFHRYINPQREVEAGALAVHGLSDAFLRDKPVFGAISRDLLAFIDGASLIIHNAPFDLGFLDHEFKLLDKKAKPLASRCQIIDTLILARQRHPGQRNSLDALCKRYGVDNSQRDLHGALLDADLLARVYLAMTGGQGSLFDRLEESPSTEEKNNSAHVLAVAPAQVNTAALKVIFANMAELAAHEQYMRELQA